MKIIFTLHVITLFLLLAQHTNAKTIYYVTQNGTGTGTSWTTASGNIQTIIDKAKSGDEVWIAKGIYYPTTETIARDARSRTFLGKFGVSLYGGFAGNETSVNKRALSDLDVDGKIDPFEFLNTTLLSGDIDGVTDVWTKKFDTDGKTWNWTIKGNENNCYHVVSNFDSTLDGFSIKGGNANLLLNSVSGYSYSYGGGTYHVNHVVNCKVSNCTAYDYGGGIYYSKVEYCKVSDCSASSGGGIISDSSVANCVVSNCSALNGSGGISAATVKYCSVSNCSARSGGGISSASVMKCVISNCYAVVDGGGIIANKVDSCIVSICIAASGGGIYSSSSVTNCLVNNCSASSQSGGGIYAASVLNCIVSNCSAYLDGGGIYAYLQDKDIVSSVEYCTVTSCAASSGGGIFSRFLINNCLVSNCSASTLGGGIYSYDHIIYNCTINNCSAISGAGIYSFDNTDYLYSVVNCAVCNCLASDSGGGIFFSGKSSVTNATNCAISNNGSSNIVGGKQISVISPDILITYVKPTSYIGIAESVAQKSELLVANWKLKKGSPSINTGIFIPYLTQSTYDLLGNSRIFYGIHDIGAYEYQMSTISLPFIEDFNSLIDFNTSSKIFSTIKLNTVNDI